VRAIEPEKGWLLLADAGPTLAQKLREKFRGQSWERMLGHFAVLQRLVAPLADELIARGVPDERPERLSGVLRNLLSHSPDLTDLTTRERDDLLGWPGRWAEPAAELAALGIPASIQHGDLHAGNVSVLPRSPVRFFDFGDASVAHPFTTMLVPLQMATALGADDQAIERLRESYLDAFTDLAPLRQLQRGLDVALKAAVLPKAAAWHRALLTAPAAHPWGRPVREYLDELR
jgi:Ser/Thr protein kinase RdoA (MazF antagonist)